MSVFLISITMVGAISLVGISGFVYALIYLIDHADRMETERDR